MKYLLFTVLLLSGLASAECEMTCCEQPPEVKAVASCGTACGATLKADCSCSVEAETDRKVEAAAPSLIQLELEVCALVSTLKPVSAQSEMEPARPVSLALSSVRQYFSPQTLPNPPPAAA